MALRGKLIRAPAGSRAHFLRESQARQAETRREFGKKFAPLFTRQKMLEARARQNESRKQTFEKATQARKALGEVAEWFREKLSSKPREVEFGGVRLSREESGALRNLVNRKKLSQREEQMVGEALEKLVRKQAKGDLKRQAA